MIRNGARAARQVAVVGRRAAKTGRERAGWTALPSTRST